MEISLSPTDDQFIQEQIKSGRYRSADEAINDALRLLRFREEEQREKLRRLKRDIEEAAASLDRGEGIPAEKVFAELDELIEGLKPAAKP